MVRIMNIIRLAVLLCIATFLWMGVAEAAPQPKKPKRMKPLLLDPSGADSGLDYFSQGGVVVDGIAYFTADFGCSKYAKGPNYPFVVAFDTRTFKKIRTYPFKDTYDGHFYAETVGSPGKVFRINATNGRLEGIIDYGAPIGSCAPCIIARAMLLSGDLSRDGIVATIVAENARADWVGPFGDPQTNAYAAPDEPEVKTVPMREVYVGVRKAAD